MCAQIMIYLQTTFWGSPNIYAELKKKKSPWLIMPESSSRIFYTFKVWDKLLLFKTR